MQQNEPLRRGLKASGGGQQRRTRLWAVCLAMAAGAALTAPAQEEVEPRWLTLKLGESYFKWESDIQQQTFSSAGGGSSTTIRTIYLAPAIGVGLQGSVYHPDLLSFDLVAEPGYAYQNIDNASATGVGSTSVSQTSWLQNYHGTATFFQTKPFTTTFSASETHDFVQYDFYDQAVVDAQNYSLAGGYHDGPVPFTLSLQQSHQDSSGLSQDLILDEQTLDFHARNERWERNFTDLTYRYSEIDQTVSEPGSSFLNNSTYQYASLQDAEHFGENDRFTLHTALIYNELDTDDLPAKTFNADENLGFDITPRLRNTYDYNFTDYSDNMSDYEQHFGRVALRHQLYDSLTTTVDLHGGYYHSGSAGASIDSQTGGFLAMLNYTKHLGDWGRLSIGNSSIYDVVDQTSSGGAAVVPNESHILTITPTPLNQPLDLSIVSVTGSTNGLLLREGFDYAVNRNVQPWEIQLIPTSTLVHSGDTVLVTYTVQANPSGHYAIFQDQFQARLDLFGRMLSLYARLNVIDNYTNTGGFVLEDIFETQAGAEFMWRGAHLSADYDDRQSSLMYTYRTEALTEGYTRKAFSDSTVSIDFHQRWTDYPSQQQNATYYDAIGRYEWHPLSTLSWMVEGGVEQQRGRGLDQDLATARTHVDWHAGKLTVNLGYEYEDQNFAGELLQRHFFYLRAKRLF